MKASSWCIRSASTDFGAKLTRRSASRASIQAAMAIVSVSVLPSSVMKAGVSCRALMRP
jgi:hypothetical protein